MYDSQRTSGESLPVWYQNEDLSTEPSPFPDASPAERALAALSASEVDVVIVGAGITGLSTAYHLLESGRSVVVLDKGDVGCGETGRSTAHISNALDDHYSVLERVHGHAGARLAAASHSAAIESIASIVEREQIECGFARVDGYLFAAHGREHDLLQRELKAARRAGLDAELRNSAPLPFATGAAVRFPNQAQFQPLAYVRGLADAIRRRGGQIVTGARVTKVDEGSVVRVHCEGGVVTGRALVIATNTPINDLFAMHTKQAAYRSYVIGVAVAKGSVERALYWDTEDPYHYVRLAGDDDILVVGGEDHKCGQSKQPEQSWERLEQWTRARFPQAGQTRFRWSGQVWEPVDHLAYIGRNPGRADNVFIATGDSGNGITHGALAGMLLTDLIVGRENPWAKLYDPSRMVTQPSAAKEFLRENLNVALSYGGYLDVIAHHEQEAEQLTPGQGMVVRRGVRRVAVYMDEAGQKHECSGVCTHLGGPVQWNSAERSWDCPCHGARFDPYGKVITGPAIKDLERLDSERQSVPPLESAAE